MPLMMLRIARRLNTHHTGKYPPGGPAEWLADGHATCNIQCSGGKCDCRMVDVRLDTLPQNLPWASAGASSASNAERWFCKHRADGSVPLLGVPGWLLLG